jgi:hypothetical protein
MPIPPIINKSCSLVKKITYGGFNKLAEYPAVKRFMDKGVKEPERLAANLFVISIISKDVIGCLFYTYQSATNKKIPEDRRPFVASLDFINGIINVGGQVLAAKLVDKKIAPWIKSLYTGTSNIPNHPEEDVNTKRIYHYDNINALVQNKLARMKNLLKKNPDKTKELEAINIEKVINQVVKRTKEPYVTGLGIVVTALLTNALIKRTASPMISTPIAGWINNKVLNIKGDTNKDNRMNYEWEAVISDKYEHSITPSPFKNISSIDSFTKQTP